MNSDNAKVARSRRATSEKNDLWSAPFLYPHFSTIQSDCQLSDDDTLTLTEALEFSEWDTTAWVEVRLRGGNLTPSMAMAIYGICPAEAAQYARENYSMSAAEVGL